MKILVVLMTVLLSGLAFAEQMTMEETLERSNRMAKKIQYQRIYSHLVPSHPDKVARSVARLQKQGLCQADLSKLEARTLPWSAKMVFRNGSIVEGYRIERLRGGAEIKVNQIPWDTRIVMALFADCKDFADWK